MQRMFIWEFEVEFSRCYIDNVVMGGGGGDNLPQYTERDQFGIVV